MFIYLAHHLLVGTKLWSIHIFCFASFSNYFGARNSAKIFTKINMAVFETHSSTLKMYLGKGIRLDLFTRVWTKSENNININLCCSYSFPVFSTFQCHCQSTEGTRCWEGLAYQEVFYHVGFPTLACVILCISPFFKVVLGSSYMASRSIETFPASPVQFRL